MIFNRQPKKHSSSGNQSDSDFFSRAGLFIAVTIHVAYIALLLVHPTSPGAYPLSRTANMHQKRRLGRASSEDSTLSDENIGSSNATGFTTRNDLQEAVQLWLSDKSQALYEYGPISQWDVSAVDDFLGLFKNVETFDEDLSHWDVSNARTMESMFEGAVAFQGRGLSIWDVRQVKDLSYMFLGAKSLSQEKLCWDIREDASVVGMFGPTSLDQLGCGRGDYY